MQFQFDPGENLEIRRKDCFKQNKTALGQLTKFANGM